MTRTLGFCSLLTAVLLSSAVALADPPTAADRATARSLAGEGYQALQTKDYSTAADRFSRADTLVHAPTLMIDWARSLVGLGKFVEAQERYEQIIREGVDAKSPKSWQKALNDAGTELAALKPRLAWVTISVSGSSEARVTIDGAPVPPAAIGVRRAINPGARAVRVVAKGYLAQKKTLDLAEGSDTQSDFSLEPDPDQQVAASSILDTAPAAEPTATKHNPVPMYVAFGIGGAGILVGGVTGALALGKHSQLAKNCTSDGACPESESQNLSSYHTLGTVSTVGFAVGIPAAAVGVVLWVLNHKNSEAPPAQQGFVIHPFVGVASVGAVGSF